MCVRVRVRVCLCFQTSGSCFISVQEPYLANWLSGHRDQELTSLSSELTVVISQSLLNILSVHGKAINIIAWGITEGIPTCHRGAEGWMG